MHIYHGFEQKKVVPRHLGATGDEKMKICVGALEINAGGGSPRIGGATESYRYLHAAKVWYFRF